ncbi:DNA polymerase alpha subunit B [Russula aff. rugulosa BPL654]|nr:DNA polymerase alpha subunit B [Russula aff. rugulosa BPL654]
MQALIPSMASSSTITVLSKELWERFGSTPGCDESFIQQCADICQTFGVSSMDLYFKWESLVIGQNAIGRFIDNNTPSSISTVIRTERMKAALAQTSKVEPAQRKPRATPMDMLGLGFRKKISGVGLVDTTPNLPSSSTMPRIGKVGTSRIGFECHDIEGASLDKRDYKYMYEKISERSGALDDRIDELADLVRQHYGLAELGDPSTSTDGEVVVVGRITLDAEASSGSGKLNEASLHIESSRLMGSGSIRGGSKGQANVGLFPGAIVALKGRNGSGDWFSVSEVMTLPPLLPSTQSTLQGEGLKQEPRDASFSMTIACGPFTHDSDLTFKPWSSLLKSLRSQKPSVVLLIGPFLDSNNEKIKTGDVDQSPTELFHTQITENLHDYLEACPDSLVLIVPSVGDIISHHCVYPQAPLDISGLRGDPRIKLLPNPCRFSLNGVTFSVTSMDILFHLRREQLILRAEEVESLEVDGQPPATDMMASLARHILQQRSFYPLFPAPLDLSHEVNLNVSHLEYLGLCHGEAASAPDVLVVPSRLKQFSKVVDRTIAINPSFVAKNISANLVFGGNGEGPISSRMKVDVGRFSE